MSRTSLSTAFFGLLSALLLAGCDSKAAVIFVDMHADRAGNGSEASPFRILQYGLDTARPGDIVYVLPGEYESIRSVRHGAEDARITIIASAPRTVIVNGMGRALDVSHRYLTFKGLVFDGNYGPEQVVRARGADYLELVDVEVRRGTPNCLVLAGTSHVLVSDSYIHHCINKFNPTKNSDSHGITGTSISNLSVYNTEIAMVSGDAIQLSPSRDAWDNVYIEGGRFWSGRLDEAINGWKLGQSIGENAIDTKVDPVKLNGHGMPPKLIVVDTLAYGWNGVISNQAAYNIKENVDAVFDRVTIRDSELAFRIRSPALARVQNAVIYDVAHAFRLEERPKNIKILNSTIDIRAKRGVFNVVEGKPPNLSIENVLFVGTKVPQIAARQGFNVAQLSSGFVDSEKHDYHLLPDAVAVDSGKNSSYVDVDRDGTPRPLGRAIDIGAYEALQSN